MDIKTKFDPGQRVKIHDYPLSPKEGKISSIQVSLDEYGNPKIKYRVHTEGRSWISVSDKYLELIEDEKEITMVTPLMSAG